MVVNRAFISKKILCASRHEREKGEHPASSGAMPGCAVYDGSLDLPPTLAWSFAHPLRVCSIFFLRPKRITWYILSGTCFKVTVFDLNIYF